MDSTNTFIQKGSFEDLYKRNVLPVICIPLITNYRIPESNLLCLPPRLHFPVEKGTHRTKLKM